MITAEKNHSLDFGEETEQLQDVLERMTEFVELYELAEKKITQRKRAYERRLEVYENFINTQLNKIKAEIEHLNEIMHAAQAADWRELALATFNQAKESTAILQNTKTELTALTSSSCSLLNHACLRIEKVLSDGLRSFHHNDFRRLTDLALAEIQQASERVGQTITGVTQWFNWKNYAIVLLLTFTTTFVMGLFINDEWPWEEHVQASKQRQIGQAVVEAWPQLSSIDQNVILKQANIADIKEGKL